MRTVIETRCFRKQNHVKHRDEVGVDVLLILTVVLVRLLRQL